MLKTQLQDIDLNQLLVLSLIFDEKNLTRAAHRRGISQPAVSRTLAALRRRFDDELLIRNGQHHTLTPFAIQLLPKIDKLLECLSDIYGSKHFDPACYQGVFSLALLSCISPAVSTRLASRIRIEAPHVHLKIHEWNNNSLEDLQNLKLDLATGYSSGNFASLRQRRLHHFYPSFAVWNDHPLASIGEVSLEELFQWPHIKLIVPGFDKSIEKSNKYCKHKRSVLIETENANIALKTFLNAKDAIINKANHILELRKMKDKVTFLRVKNTDSTGMVLQLLWHNRNHGTLAHQWFREVVFEEISRVLAEKVTE